MSSRVELRQELADAFRRMSVEHSDHLKEVGRDSKLRPSPPENFELGLPERKKSSATSCKRMTRRKQMTVGQGARTALAIRFQMALVEWLHKDKAGGYGLQSWCLKKANRVVSASSLSTQEVNWALFVISRLQTGIQLYPDRGPQKHGKGGGPRIKVTGPRDGDQLTATTFVDRRGLELVGDIQTSCSSGFFHSDHPLITRLLVPLQRQTHTLFCKVVKFANILGHDHSGIFIPMSPP